MITIKRERRGKILFNVVRKDEKVIDKRKWTKKFNVKDAKLKFKQDNTLKDKLRKFTKPNWNVIEFVQDDFTSVSEIKSTIPKYMYFVEGYLTKERKTITARSTQYTRNIPVKKAKDEAWENFYYLLADFIIGDYDKDEGKDLFTVLEKEIQIKEGAVYYVQKPLAKTNKAEAF